jgi:thiol-disulfide isomerase/thioredoxin
MLRVGHSLALVLLFAATTIGQEAEKSEARIRAQLQIAKRNPDDAGALQSYVDVVMSQIAATMDSDPAKALKACDDFEAAVKALRPATPQGEAMVEKMKELAGGYRKHIRALQSPYGELVKELRGVSRLVDTEPKEAEAKLEAIKTAAEKTAATDAGKKDKESHEYLTTSIAGVERPLIASRKLTEMIGKPAAPLKVEAWVNGSPLTDKDLQGKVVLLDFWAVWCGPCIATFPHLREWHEKYADKGLVIIGLTGYYNFKWDERAEEATQSDGEVPRAVEREMLKKFAKSHDLAHRIAVTADDSMNEYYGVVGIPHVVVIDRKGTIRMMKVGSEEQNVRAIEELLEKLVAEK